MYKKFVGAPGTCPLCPPLNLALLGCRVTVPRMQNYCSLDVEVLFHGCVFSSRKYSGWNTKHFFEFWLQMSICMKKTEGFQYLLIELIVHSVIRESWVFISLNTHLLGEYLRWCNTRTLRDLIPGDAATSRTLKSGGFSCWIFINLRISFYNKSEILCKYFQPLAALVELISKT